MARIDSLGNFLTDVADAIREKKGTNETIQASQFDTEIENLPSGADLGEYFADTLYSRGNATYGSGANRLIKKIPDTFILPSNWKYLDYFFYICSNLVELPEMDTKDVVTITEMCTYCVKLQNVPLYDTRNVQSLSNAFANCNSLTDASLDNILQMCINASSYKGTKTLAILGIKDTTIYPVSRIEALPHYQDFIDAGWTVGY